MTYCTPKILVQDQHLSIAICTVCQRIGFNYNNLLAGFDKADFIAFSKNIIGTSFKEYALPFPPHGELRTVVKTCHVDIQLAFDQQQFNELKDLLQQAILLLETEQILGAK